MEQKRIFIHCLLKGFIPYKIVKSIKQNQGMTIPELIKELKICESQIRGGVYRLLPSVVWDGDIVSLDKDYDFIVVGNRGTATSIYNNCKKYNTRFQKKIDIQKILPKIYD